MSYKSKYYNLETYYKNSASKKGWIYDDFVKTVEILENLSQEKLIEICKLSNIKLSFISEGWGKITPKEEIIGALICDYDPKTLMAAIKNISLIK